MLNIVKVVGWSAKVVVTVVMLAIVIGIWIGGMILGDLLTKPWFMTLSRGEQFVLALTCMLLSAGIAILFELQLEKMGYGCIFDGIDRWIESHMPHVRTWRNNSIDGLVLEAEYQFALTKSRTCPRIQRVMTFSDASHLQGRVTGTYNDFQEILKGCIVQRGLFWIPRTSGVMTPEEDAQMFPTIPLDEAYKIVHRT